SPFERWRDSVFFVCGETRVQRFTIFERGGAKRKPAAVQRVLASEPRDRQLAVADASVAQSLSKPGWDMFGHSRALLALRLNEPRVCRAPRTMARAQPHETVEEFHRQLSRAKSCGRTGAFAARPLASIFVPA